MKKFLFVLNIGFDRQGPSVHLLQDVILEALKDGHHVDLILNKSGGPNPEMPERLASKDHFRYHCIAVDDERQHGFLGRYIREERYAQKCYAAALKWREIYDSIFIQSTPAGLFYISKFKRLGAPIVFNIQDIFPYNLKFSGQLPLARVSFPILRKLQNSAYQKADAIVTISDDMKKTLVEDGVDARKISVIYNWSYADFPITMENILPENRFDLHLDPDKFYVVYAGNIGKMQNVELIAQAAKALRNNKDIHFCIIGDGANKAKIEAFVADLPNVAMLPMQPANYAESIYAQADLNIIPLMSGGIQTALPSKTATVMRVDKPVLFCVDEHSLFQAKVANEDGVYFSDCTIEQTMNGILQAKKDCSRIAGNFRRDISLMSVINAKAYVQIMKNIAQP